MRSLGAEMASAADGVTAYIHTDFATGTGLMLPNGVEVVVARHTILTPAGEFASQIGVGVPHAPLNNIVESTAIAEAQDPRRDLVLLRIRGDAAALPEPNTHPDTHVEAHPDTSQAAAAGTAAAPASVAALKSSDGDVPSPVPDRPARPSRHARRKGRHGARNDAAALRHSTPAAPVVHLHIVTDGPSSH